LKLVGLGDRLHHSTPAFRRREQRVHAARSSRPDLILRRATETGRWFRASARCWVNKEYGKTIVMVTHDPHAAHFASRSGTRGGVVAGGQVPPTGRCRRSVKRTDE
jgi:putative ABC transport system ATP-binding protein